MNTNKINSRQKNKWIYWCLIIFLSILFSIYYYMLQRTFAPDHEALESVVVAYRDIMHNRSFSEYFFPHWAIIRPLSRIFLHIPYINDSFIRVLRTAYTLIYFIYHVFVLDLCLRDNHSSTKKWYNLPFYIIFMVFLPMRYTSHFGHLGEHWDQFPFNQHPEALLACVISVWIVCRTVENKCISTWKKWILYSIVLALGTWIGQQIYLVAFLFPFCVVIFITYTKGQKNEGKFWWIAIGLLFAGIILIKFASIFSDSLAILFGTEKDNALFSKSIKWAAVPELGKGGLNYLMAVLGLFNLDYSQLNVYNLDIFQYLLRTLIIIFIFSCVFKCTRELWVSGSKDRIIETTICLGFVLLSCFWIFTDYSLDVLNHLRYLVLLVFYGVIILCMNSENLARFFKLKFIESKKALCIFGCVLCIASVPIIGWDHRQSDSIYWDEYLAIIETINNEKLHSGYWGSTYEAGTFIMSMTSGQHLLTHMFVTDDGYIDINYGNGHFSEDDLYYDYILIERLPNTVYPEVTGEQWKLFYKNYGYPDRVISPYPGVEMLIYDDGIKLGNRKYKKNELFTTGTMEESEKIILPANETQYGPYVTLEPNEYYITIKGENLANAQYECSYNFGLDSLEIYKLSKTDEQVTYMIQVDETIDNVEFLCQNKGKSALVIDCIIVNIKE